MSIFRTKSCAAMLASAEPSDRFKLICNRSASAARTAAHPSGSSVSIAIRMLKNSLGAPAATTADSIWGDINSASPTTATSDTASAPKLASAAAAVGTGACASSPLSLPTGRK